MELLQWGQHDWFDLLQSAGIVGSLLLSSAGFVVAVITYRRDKRARRFSNRIAIGQNHRELTALEISHPELSRVRSRDADLINTPLTQAETNFLWQRILHFSTSFQGIVEGEIEKPENLELDVRTFFERPLSRAVWEKAKPFQNEEVVAFVETCLQKQRKSRD